MKFIQIVILIVLLNKISYQQELRATWISRDNLSSKVTLAQAMDSLAKNNFNTVYVNCWSRGYPLWKSNVFFNETGSYIDPTYSGRDIMAEAIAEGHKHGIYVEAWFEYGFVGGWTGNMPAGKKGPIFDKHPDWVAKKKDGTEIDGSNFYWMVQTRPDVQNFLISLCTELVRNYDIDGIELDRIRYSSTDYGYDSYTDSLYKLDNNGQPPPLIGNNSNWIRWRADKLNEFISRSYDSIKAINSDVNISNAPSLYSSSSYTSYENYCQDWVWWVNNNKVDNVQVQSYVSSTSSFSNILTYLRSLINNQTKAFPAFAVISGASYLPDNDIYQMIDITRNQGYKGNSIWYYKDLIPLLNKLKLNRYSNKTYPPYSHPDWRKYSHIVKISDTLNAKRSGIWNSSFTAGYENISLYADGGNNSEIKYFFDIPIDGVYEIYAYQVTAPDRAKQALYKISDSWSTTTSVYIDQSNSYNGRWYKLGDFSLNKGYRDIVTISTLNLGTNQKISADAVMISLNRKITKTISSVENKSINHIKKKDFDLRAFPNPFNSNTKINFHLNKSDNVLIEIYDSLGNIIINKVQQSSNIGINTIEFNLSDNSSGQYYCRITQNNASETIKLLFLK